MLQRRHNMKILIIVPAYNESGNIENVIAKLNKENDYIDYLIINDCSTDNTKKILIKQKVDFLNLPVNLGIGGAVQAGYLYALEHDYDIALQMDGDGQHNPEYIHTLIEPIFSDTADIVIGSRFINKEGFQSSSVRRLGIHFLSRLIQVICKTKIYDVTSGFRAVNRKGISLYAHDYAQDYPEPEAIVTATMHGLRITEVPVVMNERIGGTSSIAGLKSIYYMIKVSLAIIITRFSIRR